VVNVGVCGEHEVYHIEVARLHRNRNQPRKVAWWGGIFNVTGEVGIDYDYLASAFEDIALLHERPDR
jgi:hypothetical protein